MLRPPLSQNQVLLRQLLALSGCNRKQLAGLLGIHPRTFWDYEHGVVEPPPELYRELCRHIGLSEAAFAGFLKPAARVIARELAEGGGTATPFAPEGLELARLDAREEAALEGLLAEFAAADTAQEEDAK